MNDTLKELVVDLEQAYIKLKLLGDAESLCRISRAIVMLDTPSYIEVTLPDVYWKDYIHETVSKIVGVEE